MNNRISKRWWSIAAVVLCVFTLNTNAHAAIICDSGVTITRVYQGHHVWPNLALVGIQTSSGKLFVTHNYGNINDNATNRTLLQLALTAWASKAEVSVTLDKENCEPFDFDGEPWIGYWAGLTVYD